MLRGWAITISMTLSSKTDTNYVHFPNLYLNAAFPSQLEPKPKKIGSDWLHARPVKCLHNTKPSWEVHIFERNIEEKLYSCTSGSAYSVDMLERALMKAEEIHGERSWNRILSPSLSRC